VKSLFLLFCNISIYKLYAGFESVDSNLELVEFTRH